MADKCTSLVKTKQVVTDLSLTPEKFVQAAIASELYKDTKSIAQAYIKISLGASLGIDPATAMSSIILVNGKPSFTANLIAARIKQSGKYRYEIKEKTDKKCSIQFYEYIEEYTDKGKVIKKWITPGPPEVFTIEMAKSSGLDRNPVWKSFPANMCFCRALTNGAKTYCPDVMVGNSIYTPDELEPQMKMKVTTDGDVVPDAEYVAVPIEDKEGVDEDALNEVKTLMDKLSVDKEKFLTFFGVNSLNKLSGSDIVRALKLLKEREKATPVK